MGIVGKLLRRALLCSLGALALSAPAAGAVTFSNAESINAPLDGGQDSSAIAVTGQTGTVAKVRVTLNGTGFDFPAHLDILLLAPGGQRAMLMSDACSSGSFSNAGALTFDDSAGGEIADNCGIQSTGGTFRPTDRPATTGDDPATDAFEAPAPTSGPYPATLSGFAGAAPNGSWVLYIFDDTFMGANNVDLGWSLNLDLTPPAAPASGTTTKPAKKCKKKGKKRAAAAKKCRKKARK